MTDIKTTDDQPPGDGTAADLIRDKVARIYAGEPDAGQELAEAEAQPHRSKHQQFMHQLSTSGKDLATIQTEWHQYYISLPDDEKHQVWQEFYSSSATQAAAPATLPAAAPQREASHKHQVMSSSRHKARRKQVAARPKRDLRKPEDIRAAVRDTVSANGKLTAKHHLQSLLFGLGMGFLVIFIFLFSFFNEIIIAPFIQPSRTTASTPIIVNTASAEVSKDPLVIIPKINVQIPVDYNQTSINEEDIQNSLEDGVVHYPSTVKPGEQGNTAIFGHSSNNIFNKGHYKFAFVLLHTLVPGDTFYLAYNGQMFVYKVIDKKVVDPTDVGILDAVPGHTATATLITCDPPGTTLHRLAIIGEQISPDPNSNAAPATPTTAATTTASTLPGNGPTLFGRLAATIAGKAVITLVIVGAIALVIRWTRQPRDN
ncbi:MAG: hypothetical protein JWN38_1118 [Candidatus Saccharibacteria bacterium]|nr:hypothetical protein [Candidatus Saccharibacteria bacterium]